MANKFLILELGTDTQDSATFKFMMTKRHRGRDLTPICNYPKTKFGSVTALNTVPIEAWKDPRIERWMKAFIKTKPVVLYISAHHAGSPAGVFFNGNGFGVRFREKGIRFGDTSHNLGFGKTVTIPNFKFTPVMVILDGCNCVLSGNTYSGKRFQEVFSHWPHIPVILGFQNKSPAKGTASLHKIFLDLVPKVDFSKVYRSGSVKQNELVKLWLEAAKSWRHRNKKNVVGIDNKGKIFEFGGKEMVHDTSWVP